MKYRVIINYYGAIEFEVDAKNRDDAEQEALEGYYNLDAKTLGMNVYDYEVLNVLLPNSTEG